MNSAVFRIEQAVELRAARADALSHLFLSNMARLHRLRELPSDDTLDGHGFNLFADAFFLEKAIEGGTGVIEHRFFASHFNPLLCLSMFRRASSKSFFGVACVFFTMPCKSTIRCKRST